MTKLVDRKDTKEDFLLWFAEFQKRGNDNYLVEETHPYVLKKLMEYIGTGKYPYNRDVEKHIIAEVGECDSEKLGWLVYTAQSFRMEEAERQYQQKMIADGWSVLTIKDAREFAGNHILLFIRSDGMLGTITKAVKCKSVLLASKNDDVFLFPPRCTRRGYSVLSLTCPGNTTQFYKRG